MFGGGARRKNRCRTTHRGQSKAPKASITWMSNWRLLRFRPTNNETTPTGQSLRCSHLKKYDFSLRFFYPRDPTTAFCASIRSGEREIVEPRSISVP
jgi:hypothetical protein